MKQMSTRTRALSMGAPVQLKGSSSKKTNLVQGLEGFNAQEDALDPNQAVGDLDIPGVLYANTSDSNLVRQTKDGEKPQEDVCYDWEGVIGFTTGKRYSADLSFDDLVMAGRTKSFPTAKEVGTTSRTTDYIKTPGGTISEGGTKSYALRGGEGVSSRVHLEFANNGALNLSRLARAAYNLATGKGSKIVGPRVVHGGRTYSLQCTHTMGNPVDRADARDHGFIGEFPPTFLQEKVNETVKYLAGAVSVALGRTTRSLEGHLAPNNVIAPAFQVSTPRGGATHQIEAQNKERGYWLTIPAEIAAKAGAQVQRLWAPKGNHRVRETYIDNIRDFTPEAQAAIDGCKEASPYHEEKFASIILAQVNVIKDEVLAADMNLKLIKDEKLQERIRNKNRALITKFFAEINEAKVETFISGLKKEHKNHILKPGDKKVAGVTSQDEGMIRD